MLMSRARPRWSGNSPRTRRTCAPASGVGRAAPKLGKLDPVLRLDAARTPAHDHDAVGHADGLADVMGHQDDGLVLGREDAGDLVGQREPRLVVERRERLVEQQEIGLRAERARERRALPHAAGKLVRQAVHEFAEAVAPQQLFRRGGAPCACRKPSSSAPISDVVQHRPPFEQRVLLEHVADPRRRRGDLAAPR